MPRVMMVFTVPAMFVHLSALLKVYNIIAQTQRAFNCKILPLNAPVVFIDTYLLVVQTQTTRAIHSLHCALLAQQFVL